MNFYESVTKIHECSPLNVKYEFCKMLHFTKECPSDKKLSLCCHKGKIKLDKLTDKNGVELNYLEFLKELLSNPDKLQNIL